MIPTIGVMIGCYIVTRMVYMVSVKDRVIDRIVVGILAIITIIVAIGAMIDLVATGSPTPY